jgi:hypothetical protein
MNQEQAGESRSHKETEGYSKDDDHKHKTTYWDEVTITLNYLFAEQWIGILWVIFATGFVFLFLAALNVRPMTWLVAGIVMLVAIIGYVMLRATKARRSQHISIVPTSATANQAAMRLGDIRESILRLHTINASDAKKEDQLRRLQIQVMEFYFTSVATGILPAVDPPLVASIDGKSTLEDWKRLAERLAGPSLPHPNAVGTGTDGVVYYDPPIGIAAWIDHAAALVRVLENRVTNPGTSTLDRRGSVTKSVVPPIPPAKRQTATPGISRNNPGRTFQVAKGQFGNWPQGANFTEYEFRRLHPAPAPRPGADPITALNDYYDEVLDPHLASGVIRIAS